MSTKQTEWAHLELRVSGGIAVVRLARREKRNALSVALMDELTAVARALSADTRVHAVILAGADDYFSAGADMSPGEALQRQESSLLERRQSVRIGPDMCAAWESMEQVTIAAIEGYCIGGAAALAAACDFRIAGRSAYLRLPEVALGINMSWHSLPRLVALAGPSRAKQLAIFCEPVRAHEAQSWGLVDQVVDDGNAFDEAMTWAQKVTALPPVPVRMVKEAINASALALAKSSIYMDRDQILVTGASEDFQEGVAAFFEKRKPEFKGN